jgi:hypothetical protein
MSEHKIGDQWIEKDSDSKMHMYKAVKVVTRGLCRDIIVKDLGILNEDGLLPCPFCGEYPKIIHPTENMPVVSIVHTGEGHRILLEFFRSKQQAIDAWNRRV